LRPTTARYRLTPTPSGAPPSRHRPRLHRESAPVQAPSGRSTFATRATVFHADRRPAAGASRRGGNGRCRGPGGPGRVEVWKPKRPFAARFHSQWSQSPGGVNDVQRQEF
jgi:hypothetical protein